MYLSSEPEGEFGLVVPGKDQNRFITKPSCGVACTHACVRVRVREVEEEEGASVLPSPKEGGRERETSWVFFFPPLFFSHERRDPRFIQRYDLHGFIL